MTRPNQDRAAAAEGKIFVGRTAARKRESLTPSCLLVLFQSPSLPPSLPPLPFPSSYHCLGLLFPPPSLPPSFSSYRTFTVMACRASTTYPNNNNPAPNPPKNIRF